MSTVYSDEHVAELITKIQVYVFPRRIRTREYFVDFDALRSGRCTVPHFCRALDIAGLRLPEKDYFELADYFTEIGPHIQEPQVVNYVKFCQAIDEVFADGGPSVQMMTSSPSSTLLKTFQPNSVDDEEHLMHVLHRVASLCKSRGVSIKACYVDTDRSATASPSRPNPRRGGKCTKNQFIRGFPFHKEVPPQDLDLLAERYRMECGNVHYMSLHHDVTDYMHHESQPFAQSTLSLRPDSTEWEHHTLDPVAKVRAKVVERRIRMSEHFQDFDALRKGFVTVGQLKTVFTILNLGKEVSRDEFDALAQRFCKDDGRFCYTEFCAEIDSDFTTPNLEKTPLAQLRMPDATTTAPARRNRMALTGGQQEAIVQLEDKMRYRVRTRGMLLKPTFQDMDKACRGYVTRGQFGRVLNMLGFDCDEAAVGLLCSAYCDLGNHNDVNYVSFIKSIDPLPEESELAISHLQAPHQPYEPSRYFDHRGQIDRHGRTGAVAA